MDMTCYTPEHLPPVGDYSLALLGMHRLYTQRQPLSILQGI